LEAAQAKSYKLTAIASENKIEIKDVFMDKQQIFLGLDYFEAD